ncbi:RDD family protein [Microbacterium sp. Root61]|uniref:RDD family protein n=1 Tax=Microbacterium sp. Root61 TaxID=1736570 RepID=UPI0009EAEF34|nr:RDD family protein [Microbacterium sp. Root61]
MTDPRTRPPVLIPATIGRRVGAYAIDVGVAAAIPVVLGILTFGLIMLVGPAWERDSLAWALLLAYLIIGFVSFAWTFVYTAMQGGRGSIGQRIIGLQLRDDVAGGRIGFWRALLRNIIWALGASIVVGYFSPLFDSSGKRQGWHDMVARDVVVDRKAMDAAAAVIPPPPPAPLANPYLPPPAGAPAVPAAPAATPGSPAPLPAASAAVRFAPGSPLTTQPPETPNGPSGMISIVPGVTADPAQLAAEMGRPAPADAPAAPPAPALPPVAPAVVAPATAPVSAPAAPPVPPAPAAPAAPAAPVVPPAPAAAVADEEDLDATRAGASVARAIVSLTWDDGTRVAVYGRTLFGRNPSNEPGAVAVTVRDETLSLSKTHFEIDGAADGVWVIDRHSTNGTVLVRDGARQALTPGGRLILRSGDRLEFGDRHVIVDGVS